MRARLEAMRKRLEDWERAQEQREAMTTDGYPPSQDQLEDLMIEQDRKAASKAMQEQLKVEDKVRARQAAMDRCINLRYPPSPLEDLSTTRS